MLADFLNVGMTPDINYELNKGAKGVGSPPAVYFSSLSNFIKKLKNEVQVLKSAHTQTPRGGIKILSIRFILNISICEHLPVNVADLV